MTHGTADAAHRARVLAEARRWLGTPYHHRASLRGVGTDCLGLIRGIWREIYGDEPEPLPDYTQDWAEATGAETLLHAATRHMIPVERPRPGDVLLFRLRPTGPARHVGILSGRDTAPTLIHALSPHHVTESAFSDPWRKRAAGSFAFPRSPSQSAETPYHPVQSSAETQGGLSPAARAAAQAFHALDRWLQLVKTLGDQC